jgi:S-adenosylmethionine decarboxylase proenzyme
MDTFARHLLVELHDCDRSLLNDIEHVRQLMRQAVEVAGAHVVAEVFHPYSPHGVTGVIVIEESHLSVHTWPEAGYAAVDFYTCGEVKPGIAAAVLREGLRARSAHMLEVQRGLPEAQGALCVTPVSVTKP